MLIVLGIYYFDIPGEKRTTESTTNIFQKISIIDSQVNEKVYFQDEQPVATSTIKVPFDNGFLSKDIVNSEPLSTIKERGMYPKLYKILTRCFNYEKTLAIRPKNLQVKPLSSTFDN